MPKVAIIGAGPAGLTLLNILQKKNIEAVLFEREKTLNKRGGTLDIHSDSGQLALKAAGLYEGFKLKSRSEGLEFKQLDSKGRPIQVFEFGPPILSFFGILYYFALQPMAYVARNFIKILLCTLSTVGVNPNWISALIMHESRPEIDRSDLQELLLSNLSKVAIYWDSKVISIRSDQDGRYVVLENSSKETQEKGPFDLIVGADGTWSKTRLNLTKQLPEYTGVSFVQCFLYNVDSKHPNMSKIVGNGSAFIFGRKKFITAQRLTSGGIIVYLGFQEDEYFLKNSNIPFNESAIAKSFLLKYFEDFAPFLDLIDSSDSEFAPLPIYHFPVNFQWEHQPGITLIGDAAHVMSPFGGEGVNMALVDALDLSNSLDDVMAFEDKMFKRARVAAKDTLDNLNTILNR
eukprot:NODE_51_length_31136_cov_0.357670.p5 type:complete len:403 gc:universal NODE_51_length_31136_cov_0.357670:12375-13583(+)